MTLIEEFKHGNKNAFNELYKLHYPSLLNYAELFLDADEAKDIVQDVFLNVWVHRERLDTGLSFRGYLLRSVYNSALNAIKKKGYSHEYSSSQELYLKEKEYSYYDPDANEVIHKIYNQELNNDINNAINALSGRCKEVFVLSYINDMPSKEISKTMGISLSTVDNHIYNALKQLREKLKKHKKKE